MTLPPLLQTRAHFLIDSLRPLLPPVQLRVYTPYHRVTDTTPLYLFAFVMNELLFAGYQIPPPVTQADSELEVLRLTRFLQEAWEAATPRFHPHDLLATYQSHKASGCPWHRLA